MTSNSDPLHDRTARVEEFMHLFALHQRRLYVYLLALVRNVNDAEELLQETNLILWNKFDEFQPGSNFAAWASRVAYYEVLKHREHRRSLSALSDEFLEQVAAQSERVGELLELRTAALADCLERLAPRDRDLIMRRYAPDMNGERLASELDRPVRSIYKSISRIRKQLFICISRRVALEDRP